MRYEVVVPDDLWGVSAAEVESLAADIDAVLDPLVLVRRRLSILQSAEDAAMTAADEFLDAMQGEAPEEGSAVDAWPPFVPPPNGWVVYNPGRVIRWEGRLMEPTRPGVVHSPAQSPSDWRDVTAEKTGEAPPGKPEAAPWDPEASYEAGDLTEREGAVYRCTYPHDARWQGQWGPPLVGVWELVWPL